MSDTKKTQVFVFGAELGPCESVTQLVIRQLLAGLTVRVSVNGKRYNGYVHNVDLAKGSSHLLASVCVPGLDEGGREVADECIYVKVAIYPDGEVGVLPD